MRNSEKSGASRVYITFPQITQKILTRDIFPWLEMITEILGSLQVFSLKKTTTQLFLNVSETLPKYQQKNYISGIFWTFKIKLQTIHAAAYIALFLSDSNNCFFICLVSRTHNYLYYFLILCFYFHLFFTLFSPRDTFCNLQCLI